MPPTIPEAKKASRTRGATRSAEGRHTSQYFDPARPEKTDGDVRWALDLAAAVLSASEDLLARRSPRRLRRMIAPGQGHGLVPSAHDARKVGHVGGHQDPSSRSGQGQEGFVGHAVELALRFDGSHLDDRSAAADLYGQLIPYRGWMPYTMLMLSPFVDHSLGLLAATLGRTAEADAHFAAAAFHERIGAPVWLARTRRERARLVVDHGQVEHPRGDGPGPGP